MKGSRRIVVCGASIFAAAIESGLEDKGVGEVLSFDPHLPDALARITDLNPSLIILEKDEENHKLAQEFVCRGIPVILLDELRRKIIAMSGPCLPATEIEEDGIGRLTEVIREMTAGDSGRVREMRPADWEKGA